MKPAVNFVLHAHLPWVKGAGVWPFGEEWLYQGMLDTYVPLLDLLGRLRAANIRGAITLGITPVLIEMLRDPKLMAGFDGYLDSRVDLIDNDITSFAGDTVLQGLARAARANIQNVRKRWQSSYGRDLISAFRSFAQGGEIEIITSAATHAYLPLLDSQAQLETQILNGVALTTDAFGKAPAGIWLPECGFDPKIVPVLERRGLKFFYADERALRGLEAQADRAHRVASSNIAFFARHPLARGELMDTDLGYPGNTWYREFFKRHEASGMRYWRVTARHASLGQKEVYEPARALEQIRLHAAHFTRKIAAFGRDREDAYLTFTFDAELFGHWWAEGIWWLEETLVQLQHEQTAHFEFPTSYLRRHPDPPGVALPRSSWGKGGDDRVWSNARTLPYWESVQEAGREFEDLAGRFDPAAPLMQQAARELLLLQSSDWPFMISHGVTGTYPQERIDAHALRFRECALAVQNLPHDPAIIEVAVRDDSLFSFVDAHLSAGTSEPA
ncbi:MAG: 1,4-alpha-glucan branching protein [Vulcanimicrobiaceae bacterium]